MKSFAPVDLMEESTILACKVELCTLEESINIPFGQKKTKTMYLEATDLPEEIGKVAQGDILVVEHDEAQILAVLYKDQTEKQRRIDFLSSL